LTSTKSVSNTCDQDGNYSLVSAKLLTNCKTNFCVKFCDYCYQNTSKSKNDSRKSAQLTRFKASSVVLKFKFLTKSVQPASVDSPSSESPSVPLTLCNMHSHVKFTCQSISQTATRKSKLNGCIVSNAHNTAFGSKHACTKIALHDNQPQHAFW